MYYYYYYYFIIIIDEKASTWFTVIFSSQTTIMPVEVEAVFVLTQMTALTTVMCDVSRSRNSRGDFNVDDGGITRCARLWLSGFLTIIRSSNEQVRRNNTPARRAGLYVDRHPNPHSVSPGRNTKKRTYDDSSNDNRRPQKNWSSATKFKLWTSSAASPACNSAHSVTPSTNHDCREAPEGGAFWRRGATESFRRGNNRWSNDTGGVPS